MNEQHQTRRSSQRRYTPRLNFHVHAWIEEFDAAIWDKQFEEDVKSGKLDELADSHDVVAHAYTCRKSPGKNSAA